MAKLNISQAAKLAGVHRSTLQRHIKQGKVSFENLGNGKKLIDPSELQRVYGELKVDATPTPESQSAQKHQQTTRILEQKVADLECTNQTLSQDKEQYRKDNERLMGIMEQQTRLLTGGQPKKKSGFWGWFSK